MNDCYINHVRLQEMLPFKQCNKHVSGAYITNAYGTFP